MPGQGRKPPKSFFAGRRDCKAIIEVNTTVQYTPRTARLFDRPPDIVDRVCGTHFAVHDRPRLAPGGHGTSLPRSTSRNYSPSGSKWIPHRSIWCELRFGGRSFDHGPPNRAFGSETAAPTLGPVECVAVVFEPYLSLRPAIVESRPDRDHYRFTARGAMGCAWDRR